MVSTDGQPTAAQRRRIVAEIVAACVLILLVAQALTGLLTLAAYDRLAVTASAERADLLARDTAAKIETGLRLGKPITQFFGLQTVLERSLTDMPAVTGARVVLPDGYGLADWGRALPPAGALVRASLGADRKPVVTNRSANLGLQDEATRGDPSIEPQAPPTNGGGAGGARPEFFTGDVDRLMSGTAMMVVDATVLVAVPLQGRGPGADGVLLLGVDQAAAGERPYIQRSLAVLGLTTLGAAVLMVALLGGLMSFATLTRAGGRARLLAPLAALILAQALYAADTITSFRALWLEATRANVTMLAERMQHDIERVLGMGIAVERLRGVDTLFAQFARSMPAIGEVALYDAAGRLLAGADAAGPKAVARSRESDDDLRIALPLARDGQSEVAGTLEVYIDPAVIRAGIGSRILDAATVALVSAITVFEMFLLLALLIARSARRGATAALPMAEPSAQTVARLARPVMFAFLFAWALPMSFLPLYANTLGARWLSLPNELLLALPLSAEMLLGLAGALWAGRLADRNGWTLPVFGGLVLAAVGALAAAGAHSIESFIAARAAVGLGYGLAWMGLQGYVVIGSEPAFRGRNIAWLFAGLFAGHLSGTVIGGMLADQISYRLVFLVSAVWMLLVLAGAAILARHAAVSTAPRRGGSPGPAGAAGPASAPRIGLRGLLGSLDFSALLLGSVIPFSIVQVGLLYFALPIYLQAQGVSSAGIGRVLMLYGLCMIYLGPPIGRLVDRVRRKTWAITLGALLGGGGMMWLYVDNSLFAVCLAVVLLALGSCFSGAAQTAWMLSLPRVQQFGPSAATSVLRGADKLGQMIGPLFVGAWFTVVDMGPGLAITGAFYGVASLGFFVVTARRRAR